VALPTGEQPARIAIRDEAAYALTGSCTGPSAACEHERDAVTSSVI
jgi:hypothetical protein